MSKTIPADTGVPVRLEESHFPSEVPVALPLDSTDVPESSDSGSKSGQKAATKKES